MAIQDEDDDDIDMDADPLTILQPDQHEETTSTATPIVDDTAQQHYLQSIDSTVVIRQLPSQGLSFQLWPAATTLVSLLEQHQLKNNTTLSSILNHHLHLNRPLRILELGSGTGLVGIAAAAILGANVTLTDLPHVLDNLQFNATENANVVGLKGGIVNVKSLRWGEVEDVGSIGEVFDVILGSDVVYYDYLFEPLLSTLQLFLNGDNDVVFLMAHLKRWKKDSAFFKKARKMFEVQKIHSDPPSPGSRIGVVVYSFAGKHKRMSVQ